MNVAENFQHSLTVILTEHFLQCTVFSFVCWVIGTHRLSICFSFFSFFLWVFQRTLCETSEPSGNLRLIFKKIYYIILTVSVINVELTEDFKV